MSYSNYYAVSGLFHGAMSSAMGTQLDVLLLGKEPKLLGEAWNEVETEVRRLDRMLSRFVADGEVALVNRDAGHFPVSVSDELWAILQDCRRYYEWTNGCFDITMQDFSRILLSDADKSVFFFSETMQIDLGGYGKGYALQKIQTVLKRKGVTDALVNFGNSSVLALGSHPCGAYWPVSINNPYTQKWLADFKLKDCSLSTSGNMPSNPRHIINPHTGLYVEDKRMVSVIADDPLVAEVLTTAFMILPDEQVDTVAGKFDIYEKHLYTL